jgi:hypothetical protein
VAVQDYCTIAEIKAALPNTKFDTTYDTLLTALATRASRELDRLTNRKPGAFFVNADVIRYYDGPGSQNSVYGTPSPVQGGYPADQHLGGGAYWSGRSLWIGELAAAPTEVAVTPDGNFSNYQVWAATDYILWPYNALDDGRPYTRIDLDLMFGTHFAWWNFRRAIRITGKFGYAAAVPDDIKQAAIIQAARWFKRGQLNYQDLGVVTDSAQLVYQNKIDSDVEIMVQHLRKQAI